VLCSFAWQRILSIVLHFDRATNPHLTDADIGWLRHTPTIRKATEAMGLFSLSRDADSGRFNTEGPLYSHLQRAPVLV